MSKEINIKIPDKIEDIRLGQYQQYIQLIADAKGEIVYNYFMKMKIVSIFCNVPFELVRSGFIAKDVEDISDKVIQLLDKLSKESQVYDANIFKVRNTEFGIEPDFENISSGAFADLTEYFGKPESLHKVMAVLCRPIAYKKRSWFLKITQYELQPYDGTDKYAEIMKGTPAIIALKVNFYFSSSFIKLRQIFLTYMGKKALEIVTNPQDKEILKRLESSIH